VGAFGCSSVLLGHCTKKFWALADAAAIDSNTGKARIRSGLFDM
jgi:hypothetical protein